MALIKKIVLCYWNVSQLKESPQNTPYSAFLGTLSFILLSLILTLQWALSGIESSDNLVKQFIISTSLALSFIIYTAAILFFKGLSARFIQTSTCLLGAFSIIHLLALPLFALDPYLIHINLKNPIYFFIAVLYLFFTLGLSLWQFIITAHIYKHALNASPVQSVLAAFGLVAVNILTLSFWR